MATYFQIEDPVKPTTVETPSLCAARAVHFISSAARARTPSASPSPIPGPDRRPMPLVDGVVAHCLSDEMVGDGPDAEVVLGERGFLARQVGVVLGGQSHVEMIAPAGNFEPVISPGRRQPTDFLERQVGPLSGEQRVIGRLIVVTDPAGRGCRRYGPPPARRSP